MSTTFEIPHGEGNPRNSEGSFVTLKDGRILFAYTQYDGETWQAHQMIESQNDHGYCYTAIHFTNDNAALLAYCCGGGDCWPLQDLRIRRIELSELSELEGGLTREQLMQLLPPQQRI